MGKLDKRVTIEKKVSGRDAAGEPRDVWEKVKTIWANVRFERGSEFIRNNKNTAVTRASIRVRYREDVDEGMRIVYGKRILNIVNILPDENEKKWLDIIVEGSK